MKTTRFSFFRPLVSAIILLPFLINSGKAQEYARDYSEPDYLLFAFPTLSAGATTYSGDVPASYSRSTAPSYNFGLGFAVFLTKLARHIFAVPELGIQYSSKAVNFNNNQALGNTIQINSIDISGGIAFPFVQLLLNVDFPIAGSSSLHLNSDADNVVKIHANDLRITVEPRAIFYYVFPLSENRSDALVPFISAGFPVMNVLPSPYSLDKQSFESTNNVIKVLKMSSIQIGIIVGIEIERHYSGGASL